MAGSVILEGARTPIGRLAGALASKSAAELGAVAIAEALRRAKVGPEAVDYVIMGQVLQAGQGGNAARQAATLAGIGLEVPAMTINKMCLSGMQAIALADRMIRTGEAEVVVAGGMESMTRAPYLLEDARAGFRFGDQVAADSIMKDGLLCAFGHAPMGAETERYAAGAFSREELDEYALRSHQRAAGASRVLAQEIVPVETEIRRTKVAIETDEGVRADSTFEALSKLRPAFSEGGTITAGNASQISDGAAALVVSSASAAARLGVEPLGEVLSCGEVAGPDTSLLTQPSRALRVALERADLKVGDLERIEINEAFATVALASIRDLGASAEITNVNGGAIALGHPIGMSGARLVLTLGYELRREGLSLGAAALCGGGGQGDALVLRLLR